MAEIGIPLPHYPIIQLPDSRRPNSHGRHQTVAAELPGRRISPRLPVVQRELNRPSSTTYHLKLASNSNRFRVEDDVLAGIFVREFCDQRREYQRRNLSAWDQLPRWRQCPRTRHLDWNFVDLRDRRLVPECR